MIALDSTHGPMLDTLIQWFSPWQTFFSHSKTAGAVVMFVHLAGLFFGGGFAVAADRTVLRLTSARAITRPGRSQTHWEMLDSLDAVHRPVLIGLTFVILSGLALATADIETFATSPVFWTKMALVALLAVNGLLLMRTETALRMRHRDTGNHSTPASHEALAHDPLWHRLRLTAFASITLWTAVLLAGTILASS